MSLKNIEDLSKNHREPFRRALSALLSTDIAEETYAQILDGLPTKQSLRETYIKMDRHPVFELDHTSLCEGIIERTRAFKAQFDASKLCFEHDLLEAFQNTVPGSREFNMRLIELVVVASHQIAVYLFKLDDGAHKHKVHDDWLQQQLMESILQSREGVDCHGYDLPPVAFFHTAYMYYEQYPQGLADVVGYWAEGRIFGGVVVFDRGESEQECKEMWIHGFVYRGPGTLYPPTSEQFDSLLQFLLSPQDEGARCPLPILGTRDNHPRWDPYDALAHYHIFRDKFERKLPPERPSRHKLIGEDWPEIGDEWIVLNQDFIRNQGAQLSEEIVAAARARLRKVTPSSPCWGTRNS